MARALRRFLPLPMLAAGFIAGIALGDLVATPRAALIPIAIASILAGWRWRDRTAATSMLAAIAMLCAGAVSVSGEHLRAAGPKRTDSFDGVVEATVCGRSVSAWSESLTLCQASEVGSTRRGVPERLALQAAAGSPASASLRTLREGERIRAWLRLRPVDGLRNPGRTAGARRFLRRGIGARASLVHPSLVVRMRHGGSAGSRVMSLARPGALVASLRARIGETMSRGGAGSGLIRALAIGDRSALDSDVRDGFVSLGLAHLLAVSGLHLALTTAAIHFLMLRLLARSTPLAVRWDVRWLSLLFAACFASGYAVLCGFDVPVRRALVFVWAVVASLLIGRVMRPIHVIALAALWLLVLDPAALFDLGAQLSFAVTTAFLLMRGADPPAPTTSIRWRDRVRWRLAEMLSASAVAVAISAPILALHGRTSSLAALWLNCLAIPWTAFVLLPSALAASLAAMLDLSPLTPAIVTGASRVAELTSAAVVALAELHPATEPGAPIALWSGAVAGLLASCALLPRRTLGRVAIAIVVALWLRFAPPRTLGPSPPRVVMFDVGQGDAVLIQGTDASMLVDGGRAVPGRFDLGESVVLPGLRALGVRRLDVVVATHADLDHRGGLPAILRALPVAELWLPDGGFDDEDFAALIQVAVEEQVPVIERSAASPMMTLGDMTIRVLWPHAGDGIGSRNHRSLVLEVTLAGRRLLMTGDLDAAAESRLLEAGVLTRFDVLKVAHHGSTTSTSSAFLRAIAPGIALVSAPCGGRTGLPAVRVLERLERAGIVVGWTGRVGAVALALSGGSYERPLAAARPIVIQGWAPPRTCDAPPARLSPRQRARRSGATAHDMPISHIQNPSSGCGIDAGATNMLGCHGDP